MRHNLPQHPPFISTSPSPSPAAAVFQQTAATQQHGMLLPVFFALFLPCAGMSVVFVIYISLIWYGAVHQTRQAPVAPPKAISRKGLSESDLEKIPKVAGKDLRMGTECAVCLDEIGSEEAARMVPGCNHGFHLECADSWLSMNPICPVCRAKLDSHNFFIANSSENCYVEINQIVLS